MRNILLILIVGLVLASCGNKPKEKKSDIPTKDFLKSEIVEINDSLKVLYKDLMENPGYKFPTLAVNEAVFRHLQYYRYYPKDDYAAICLDKVQQLYLQEKAYELSLNYTDTLLTKYPNYKNRATLLLNAGSTGEILQDTSIIRKYYSQLLSEFPNLEKETKEMVSFRLKHLNLTFDQLIDLQIKKTAQKK